MIIRLPIALLGGLLFSLGLFWLMWTLISQPIDVSELRNATRIEFQRMRQDTAAYQTEVLAWCEREREPPQ